MDLTLPTDGPLFSTVALDEALALSQGMGANRYAATVEEAVSIGSKPAGLHVQ
jgi:hypothetical protein